MAAVMKNQTLANIAVEEVISEPVFSCNPEDDVHTALKTMQDRKVHRLPIVGSDGTLEGILSMNDIVLKAEEIRDKKIPSISFSDVVNTYKSICQHRIQEGKAQAAAGI
jgi:CBS domain-containing protein